MGVRVYGTGRNNKAATVTQVPYTKVPAREWTPDHHGPPPAAAHPCEILLSFCTVQLYDDNS